MAANSILYWIYTYFIYLYISNSQIFKTQKNTAVNRQY